jgi:hypothetical protein
MHFYPKLHGAFRTLAIEVVSARDLFSGSDPKDQLKWKVTKILEFIRLMLLLK